MFFHGALNIDGAGARVLSKYLSNDVLCYVFHIHFQASNNVAEYEAYFHGLRITMELGIKSLMVYEDSTLVIN